MVHRPRHPVQADRLESYDHIYRSIYLQMSFVRIGLNLNVVSFYFLRFVFVIYVHAHVHVHVRNIRYEIKS